MNADELKTIASTLAGVPIREVVQASNGGNSRVYMAAAKDKLYALKQYPTIESDKRDRLNTERLALDLMHWHGVHSVPYYVAAESPYGLMSWVDGAIIKTPKENDIDDAAVFLGTLHHISQKTHAEDVPLASEACLSGQIIIDQIEKRTASLMPYSKENPALMDFFTKKLLPTFQKRLIAARKAYPEFSMPLPQAKQTLIAADFGFHNIMRALDGRLYFIDFEYFGWDDPVKLMCDFLLHPATPLTPAMKQQFYKHMIAIYGTEIEPRFNAYYPLFGLRWALILLNEFIPERWHARVHARGVADWEQVKSEQLGKAEAMLTMSESFS
jgi:hypothetical protein